VPIYWRNYNIVPSFLYINGKNIFFGGWAFVEFYFMLTGYYTTEHFLKHSEKVGAEYRDIFYYIKNKIKKIYPYAVGGGIT